MASDLEGFEIGGGLSLVQVEELLAQKGVDQNRDGGICQLELKDFEKLVADLKKK